MVAKAERWRTNSQESAINKERSGRSCFDGAWRPGRSFSTFDNTFLTEQTSWIKMCIADLVKHFSLYIGHI